MAPDGRPGSPRWPSWLLTPAWAAIPADPPQIPTESIRLLMRPTDDDPSPKDEAVARATAALEGLHLLRENPLAHLDENELED
ncbi:hypothetical protein HDK77DRAFT_494730 [Phyllosticta capitalensis]|uniref:Uncharacterized protein n=1 Tax=Phyllosticta capitalensis TaxID=121624 RepID=A0ABR1YRN8_9PEZI